MITASNILQYLQITVTAWVTAHAYTVGTYVSNGGTIYYCIVAHTSGTFATDRDTNLYWSTTSPADNAVAYAIERVNGYCNRDFRQQNYTDYLSGDETNIIFVNNFPLSVADGKVTLLQYFDDSTGTYIDIIDNSTQALINTNTNRLSNGQIRLLNGYTFTKGSFNIKITYEGGYASTSDVYKFIASNCLELGAMWFKNSFVPGGGLLGAKSRDIGGQSDKGMSIDFEAQEKLILSRLDLYRKGNV